MNIIPGQVLEYLRVSPNHESESPIGKIYKNQLPSVGSKVLNGRPRIAETALLPTFWGNKSSHHLDLAVTVILKVRCPNGSKGK